MKGDLRVKIYMMALFALILSGCLREAKVPIPTIYHETNTMSDNCTLFVYLPGNGDSPEAFEKNGLFRSLQERGIATEVAGVDAHLGYYSDNSLVARLKEDVIEPARIRGVRNIWLVGNSLGGVGSLMYIRKHADEIAGVVLLGPFVGDKEIIEEIKRSGELLSWDPGNVTETDWQRQLLVWLKEYVHAGHYSPPIYLGYGKNDRFAYAQDLLAANLPPERVIAIEGGHDWQTWGTLWKLFLKRLSFDKCP
jgi:pimeloyl-ACP methyl ester carboxylesterase